jgi:hypothetical protein
MRLPAKYVRSVSLFVVIFLCLNPAAVFCLAYCSHHVQAAAVSHCPLNKGSVHCHHSQRAADPQDTTSIEADLAKRCVMPVNIIAAPVESKFGLAVDAVAAAPVERIEVAPAVFVRSRLIPKFYYRPPPNDARFERVRNQVFRI